MHTTRVTGTALGLGLALALALGIVTGRGFAAADQAAPMSAADTEVAVSGYLDAILEGGDFAAYLADDVVLTIVGGGEDVVGLAAVSEMIEALHYVIFDSHPEITSLVIGEGQAALEADFIATQTGEFAGIAATGTAVDVPYSVFYELEDGRITVLRVYGLVDGLVQQLQAATTGSEWAAPPSPERPGQPY